MYQCNALYYCGNEQLVWVMKRRLLIVLSFLAAHSVSAQSFDEANGVFENQEGVKTFAADLLAAVIQDATVSEVHSTTAALELSIRCSSLAALVANKVEGFNPAYWNAVEQRALRVFVEVGRDWNGWSIEKVEEELVSRASRHQNFYWDLYTATDDASTEFFLVEMEACSKLFSPGPQ